jgi:hypothetical protein
MRSTWTVALVTALLLVAAPARAQAPFEPNDSAAQATGPMVAGQPYAGAIETINDADWFFFVTTRQVQLDISILGVPGFMLRDADGFQLNVQVGSPDVAGHILQTVGPGRYYLQVTPRFAAGETYRLQVDPPGALSQGGPAAGPVGVRPLPPAFGANGVFVLPNNRRCVSRRNFRIRIRRQRRGVTLVSAAVAVNGRRVAVRRGARLTAPVDLRGLPRGRFTVRISALTADGRAISGTRRYRTCARRGPPNEPGPV